MRRAAGAPTGIARSSEAWAFPHPSICRARSYARAQVSAIGALGRRPTGTAGVLARPCPRSQRRWVASAGGRGRPRSQWAPARSFPPALSQGKALDLARGALGQFLDEGDEARRLVGAEKLEAMGSQRAFLAMQAGLDDHGDEDVLAVILVGHADRRGLEHGRMCEQSL